MSLRKVAIGAALTVLTLVGSTASSFAYDAYATVGVNVRDGAGTSYYKIGSLYAGQKVDVDYCEGGWCFVSWSSYEGWVAERYLADHHSGGGYNRRNNNYSGGGYRSGY